MVHDTLRSAGGKLPQAICFLPPNGAAHLQQPWKKDRSKVAFNHMWALALMGKNHVAEDRGEEFVLYFILYKGMELLERLVDIPIAINRGEQ